MNDYITELCANDKLYWAIRDNNFAEIERLKSEGVALSDYMKRVLTVGGGRIEDSNEYGMDWYDFSYGVSGYGAKGFVSMIRNLREAVGEPLYYSETVNQSIYKILFEREVFECVLDCFNGKRISNKKWKLREIVDKNDVELLKISAEYGWLKQAKQRDDLIEYAKDNNRPECVAWILAYVNRTVDFDAERAKTAKKQERILNAAPDSVTTLKTLWNYRKREDGTLIITGYKGDKNVVDVPEKIGSATVAAIGKSAFSPFADRISDNVRELRRAITEIKLPESVTEIGKEAFSGCENLRAVNIPNGITEIAEMTFIGCRVLENITIPGSVKTIGNCAFHSCDTLSSLVIPEGVVSVCGMFAGYCIALQTIELPRSLIEIQKSGRSRRSFIEGSGNAVAVVEKGSYAEEYCKKYKIKFTER